MARTYKKSTFLIDELPQLTFPTAQIAKHADFEGKYCVESQFAGCVYICDKGAINIVTGSNGFLCLKEEDLKIIAEEALGIIDDLEFMRKVDIKR